MNGNGATHRANPGDRFNCRRDVGEGERVANVQTLAVVVGEVVDVHRELCRAHTCGDVELQLRPNCGDIGVGARPDLEYVLAPVLPAHLSEVRGANWPEARASKHQGDVRVVRAQRPRGDGGDGRAQKGQRGVADVSRGCIECVVVRSDTRNHDEHGKVGTVVLWKLGPDLRARRLQDDVCAHAAGVVGVRCHKRSRGAQRSCRQRAHTDKINCGSIAAGAEVLTSHLEHVERRREEVQRAWNASGDTLHLGDQGALVFEHPGARLAPALDSHCDVVQCQLCRARRELVARCGTIERARDCRVCRGGGATGERGCGGR
mmetsp:Transcript_16798/g.57360  ORF Transcript_16798/g.57360 Transcript_16798/m.57360 type:complete len:318 (-) Transcript_16798:4654-5607(-)